MRSSAALEKGKTNILYSRFRTSLFRTPLRKRYVSTVHLRQGGEVSSLEDEIHLTITEKFS
ncbi:hypothetical protein SAMN05421755_11344 [Nitrosomonas sp. Nm33]|nr:hypothetical protein SAMN05421755_11344 [Nitrosomonas sp. Nm33]